MLLYISEINLDWKRMTPLYSPHQLSNYTQKRCSIYIWCTKSLSKKTEVKVSRDSSSCGSDLESYTSNNTKQHDTTWVQHETTRDNTSKTRVQYETTQDNTSITRDNTSAIRHNTNTKRPNTSTKEILAAKLGLYFALFHFVTELYIFLIFFRSS